MTEEHRVIRPDYARRIEAFRLLDDTFLSTVFDNRPKLAEKMLRIVLGRDDIEVLDVKAQVRIPKSAGSRSRAGYSRTGRKRQEIRH